MTRPTISGRFSSERIVGVWDRRRHLLTMENVPLFTFHNDPQWPLTIVDRYGKAWRPNRTFDKFDMGSVPLIFQGSVSPILCPEGFAAHDSGYEFWGLWEVMPDGVEIFRDLPRAEVDRICLLDGLEASGVSLYTRHKVYAMVRLGGGGPWERSGIGANEARSARMPPPMPGKDEQQTP